MQRIIILCLLFCSSLLFGAELTITVIDEDLGIPLDGARITTGDGKVTVCDSRGKAVLEIPENRTVVVQISYPGYQNKRMAVQSGTKEYTASLRLGGVLQARELVIEEQRPDSSKTESGRSVALSGRDLTRQSETGFVEDVMHAVKLLPGVGYVGGYMAMPSVRGGEPEDVTAVYDGFYVERPYHWGGAFSIFDPKMVESAQLSHGVFSARYGQTISGLLNIESKSPPLEISSVDLAVSTSATNLNLSFPLGKQGGMSLMGRVTYWDPFVETAKLFFEEVRYITTAPYIRSSALSAFWDFSTDLSLTVNGFFGGDGVAVNYEDNTATSIYKANISWDNKIGFLASTLNYSPRQNLLLKTRLGFGILQNDLDGTTYSKNLKEKEDEDGFEDIGDEDDEVSVDDRIINISDKTYNVQFRVDFDWDIGRGIIISSGIEEKYSRWDNYQYIYRTEDDVPRFGAELDVINHGLFSSLYSLVEYKSEDRSFGAEAGIRVDHFLLSGKGFLLKGIPVVNPRINANYTLFEAFPFMDSITFTAGSGLFSSINSSIKNISRYDHIPDTASTQNRSWTNVLGTKIDFSGFVFTLEGYVKNVFNRAYFVRNISDDSIRAMDFCFDGKAFIWGFDCMLQKMDSRYWDGWISYSYIDAKYKDPQSKDRDKNSGGWYYPDFHRFHTLNFILNYKPVPAVQLTTRFSLASGIPLPKTEAIVPDSSVEGSPPPYVRIQVYDDNNRAGLVMPLDIKLAFLSFNPKGKVQRELYISFENLLSLLYTPEGRKDFDSNTGRETIPDYTFVSYDLPIPLITFGIKWSY